MLVWFGLMLCYVFIELLDLLIRLLLVRGFEGFFGRKFILNKRELENKRV